MRWPLGALALLALSVVLAGGTWANAGILAYHGVCAGSILLHRRSLGPLFARRPGLGPWILGAAAAFLAGLALLALLWNPARVREPAAAALFAGPDRLRSFAVTAAYTMVFHASLEEIFWRGVFTDVGTARPAAVLWGNAASFYLVHVVVLAAAIGPWGFLAALPTAPAGLAWGWITLRTRSLWPALVSHWAADAAILGGMWYFFLRS